ncbi:hypothetical protein AQUCO_00700719v1 [Aquilegia coerulea]|uniref:Uncharacterized protein n=1 Tax=Aquilegia coerulea TaxID=218851 RepID=A0A2G5ELF8_AQUCA|nr:hypothetical protein AQUCO_00700719v1 [Aquilegia coerulea]
MVENFRHPNHTKESFWTTQHTKPCPCAKTNLKKNQSDQNSEAPHFLTSSPKIYRVIDYICFQFLDEIQMTQTNRPFFIVTVSFVYMLYTNRYNLLSISCIIPSGRIPQGLQVFRRATHVHMKFLLGSKTNTPKEALIPKSQQKILAVMIGAVYIPIH